MAAGLPVKTSWAANDVFTSAGANDLAGTVNLLGLSTVTATAAGTTVLIVASNRKQTFTGTTTQTVTLPVVSTLSLGDTFEINNSSTGVVTVQSSGANSVLAMAAGTRAVFTCVLITGTTAASWSAAIPAGSSFGLFAKASRSCAFTVTGVGTISIAAGTYVDVSGTLITFAAQTAVTMPALTAGTDYFIYVSTAGVIQAVAASGTWPTPVASPPASSRLIGGFHYAPGSNATAQAGGNTTPQINAYSVWDLKWKPATDDPRGMALVADKFWADIYLLNRDPQTNGTSKNNIAIADGETGSTTTCIIPTMFGGNGTLRYAIQDWWSTAEALTAFGKRLPTCGEMQALAYGVTENQVRGTDPVTTGLGTTNAGTTADQLFTSKWGIIQATGVMYIWAHDLGGPYASAAWTNNNGGRGQTYALPNAAVLGAYWGDGVYAGSRSSAWNYSPSNSANYLSGRGVCDHLSLV
jgi:hypothetical protein